MSESVRNSAVAPAGDVIVSNNASANTKQHLLAALFSALIPGAGQLLLGQRRKGLVLLLLFVVVISCVWPQRFPRFMAAFVLIALCWLVLSFYAAWAALLEHRNLTDRRTSKWWLLAVPLLTYIGFNTVFTPLFLMAGFRALKFNSSSMETTLLKGDQFIVDKMFYRDHPAARGDLVVLLREDYQTVKRVIAIGGDTIEARNRQIVVNGQSVTGPFISHTLAVGTTQWMDSFGPVTVPAGKYFVMGDNRDVSLDSRSSEFGLVDARAITGRPLYIYRSPIQGRAGKRVN